MKKKIIYLIGFFLFSLMCFGMKVQAASWTIISNTASVSPSGTFSVRIHGNVVGSFSISVSNGSASTSSIWKDENADASFTVTAGGGGSTTVVVNAVNVSDTSYNTVTGSDDVTVSIRNNSGGGGSSSSDGSRSNSSSSNKTYSNNDEDVEESENNFLKSLSVEGFSLSPSFKKDVFEYTVEVDETTEKIKIDASAEDDKARVDGLGEKSVLDSNSYQVVVTAEDGKTRTYTLKFVFKDSNPIKITKGKKTYTVVKRKAELVEFDDYKYKTIRINDIDIPALYNSTTKLTLVGLKYNNKVYLYRYDKKNNSYIRYIEYDFKNVKLVLFSPNKKQIPTGFKQYKEKINGHNVNVYKLNRTSNYSLIYGMNVVTGKKALYLHDKKENTVQRYTSEMMTSLKQQGRKFYKLCIILSGIIIFLILVLLLILTKKDRRKTNGKEEKIRV